MKTFALVLATLGLCSSSAYAANIGDACDTNADCGTGLACEVVGGSDCACAAGSDGEQSCEPCEQSEDKACMPGPCESDDDCGGGFVCYTFELPCVGTDMPSCDPDDEDCRPVESEPADCAAETRSLCAPKWVLPCEDDAACGAGFTCEAEEICSCTGSSGGGASDPREPDGDDSEVPREETPEEEACDCQPSDEKWCHADEVECESDDQCPSGWTCHAGDTASTPCAMPDDGSEPNCAPVEVETTGYCYPPGVSGEVDFDDAEGSFGIPTNGNHETNETPRDAGKSLGEPSSGCNAAPGSFALMLAGLALVARRRQAAGSVK